MTVEEKIGQMSQIERVNATARVMQKYFIETKSRLSLRELDHTASLVFNFRSEFGLNLAHSFDFAQLRDICKELWTGHGCLPIECQKNTEME
ncbi:beta-glucosidase [Trifolium repens]|nr:beta-glucosidase [Trifolium repens]